MADASVRVVFTGDAGSATAAVRRLEGSFAGLGRVAKTVAGVAGIAGVGIALKNAGKAAIDFDKGMRNVNSIAKLSEKDFQSLSKQVLALAGPTAQAPKVLAEGLYDIVSSGFKANDAVKILAVSAKAATAGLTDTATATKGVTAVLNAYHLGADQARKVSDVLFQTVNKGVITFEELAGNIGDVLPFAASLGVSLEEVGGAIATMTLQGLSGAESFTRLKSVFTQLLKPGDDLKAAIKGLGFESGEAMLKQLGLVESVRRLDGAAKGNKQTIAAWMQDVRAIGGFLSLSGKNMDTFTASTKSMDQASKGAGATARAFAEQSKSLAFQWEKAKQSLTAAAIPIAQLLFPALTRGAQAVASFAGAVQSKLPQVKSAFSSIIDAVKPLGSVLGDALGNEAVLKTGVLVGSMVALAAGFRRVRDALIAVGVAAKANPLFFIAGAVAGISTLASQLLGLNQTLIQTKSAFELAAQASRAFDQATTSIATANDQVTASNLRLEAAELNVQRALQNRRQVEADAGRGSLEFKEAQLAVKQAYAERTAAAHGVTQAEEALGRAEKQRQQAMDQILNQIAQINQTSRNLMTTEEQHTGVLNRQGVAYNTLMVNLTSAAKGQDQYGKAIEGSTAASRKAAAAALYLVQTTGKIPSRKDIKVALEDAKAQAGIIKLLQQMGVLEKKQVVTKVEIREATKGKIEEIDKKLDATGRKKVSPEVRVKLEAAKKDLEDVLKKLDKAGNKKSEPRLALIKTAFDRAFSAADKALKRIDKEQAKPKITADNTQALSAIGFVRRALDALNGKTATTYVKTVYSTSGQKKAEGGFVMGLPGFAAGGFLPGTWSDSAPDSIPVMAKPGELFLTRAQQNVLGGPAHLASLFGFTPPPDVGGVQHFAGGGHVAHKPPRKKRPRYKAKAKEVAKIQAQLDRNEEAQNRSSREFDQMSRIFDISVEDFINVDANGNESLNTGGIAQRVSELNQLIAKKDELIGLIDKEKSLLEQLLAALKAAVDEYLAEARRQANIVKAETRIIKDLTKDLNAATDDGVKSAIQSKINEHERKRDKAGELRDTMKQKAADLKAELPDVRRNLRTIDLDRRDVEIDQMELRAQITEVQNTKPSPPSPTGDTGGGSDTGAGADTGAADNAALQAIIDELKRQLAELRLALGIENVQLPLIGAFQTGSIFVPQTGLAMLHAGEQVLTSGRPRLDKAREQDTVVDIRIADGMAWLAQYIDTRVVKGSAKVSVKIGQEADRRARSGEAGALSAPSRRL